MEFTNRVKEFFGFKERPQFEQTAPATWPNYPLLTPWVFNRDNAIDYKAEVGDLSSSSLVMAVVNWTGTQLTEAPVVVQKPAKNNVLEIDLGNPAADILANPNPFDIFDNYCGVMSLDWWIPGNHFWYLARNGAGQVVELWYLPSFMVEPRWPNDGRSPEVPAGTKDAFITHYQYSVPGVDPVLYPASDILHIKRSIDPLNRRKGIGAFGPVVREIFGDNAIGNLTATLMKNMGMVPYVISPKEQQSLTPTEAEAVKEKFILKTQGPNVGQPIVNAIPMDITKLGLNPSELDLSKLRMIPESRVAAVTGIPAAMLQFMVGLENGTSYASYKEARQQGYESVVIPIQRTIARQLTKQLLPEFDRTKGAVYAFDITQVRVLQEDRDSLYKRAVLALSQGGLSRNEFARSLGKEAPDKEEIFYVPNNVTPMTQDLIEQTAAEKPEPPVAAPVVDPNALSKFADMDRMMEEMEEEMKGFTPSSEEEPKRVHIGYKLKNVEGVPADTTVEITVNRKDDK
jgi:phage portal protein BeeE